MLERIEKLQVISLGLLIALGLIISTQMVSSSLSKMLSPLQALHTRLLNQTPAL